MRYDIYTFVNGHVTGTNCIYYERNKDLCVPGKWEQWWGGMMAMLAPLLQQKGIDPNLLVAMNSRNNSGSECMSGYVTG